MQRSEQVTLPQLHTEQGFVMLLAYLYQLIPHELDGFNRDIWVVGGSDHDIFLLYVDPPVGIQVLLQLEPLATVGVGTLEGLAIGVRLDVST